jgi:phenylpropionate dioxygenase-like ring-hydroxylating dioxygenase large terminal subunit|tara:strand:- start:933 stop:1895 length:963 start_codon:yes stop_codon:yes gene_type:complete
MNKLLLKDWYVICRKDEIEENKILLKYVFDQEIIIWKKKERIMAWENLCIHRGSRLSLGSINNGILKCAYHGWEYNQDAQCVKIPSQPDIKIPKKACVKSYKVIEKMNMVWINLSKEANDFVNIKEFNESNFNHVASGPYIMNASAPRAIENFLDVAHFPFVHENHLGVKDKPMIDDYDVVSSNKGIHASNIKIFQPNPDGTNKSGEVIYDYHVHSPFVASLGKDVSKNERFVLVFYVTPISETESMIYTLTLMNFGKLDDKIVRDYQDFITAQDVPIVESQRPELLPMDLQEELSIRSDKISIAYRRYLKKMNISFGVA